MFVAFLLNLPLPLMPSSGIAKKFKKRWREQIKHFCFLVYYFCSCVPSSFFLFSPTAEHAFTNILMPKYHWNEKEKSFKQSPYSGLKLVDVPRVMSPADRRLNSRNRQVAHNPTYRVFWRAQPHIYFEVCLAGQVMAYSCNHYYAEKRLAKHLMTLQHLMY